MEKTKKDVLWISKSVPYDGVPHAGGKIHNFYLKELNKNKNLKIHLISMCDQATYKKLDLDTYQISNDIIVRQKGSLNDYVWKILNQETKHNPWNRYAGFAYNSETMPILTAVKRLKKLGYNPSVIILQWTQIILLTKNVKEIFPSSKIIAIEEDVSFLGLQRKADIEKAPRKKESKTRKYEKLKRLELDSLALADTVILNNPKDEKLLLDNGLQTNTMVWAPYFQSMLDVNRKEHDNTILFYGAMNRPENWESAIWFIDNVMSLLKDEDVVFVVAGNKPPEELKSKASERIKILGFVEDIKPLFQTSLCLVAPLLYGAGVKVKIIEGLSSGIPVLTNSIGAEGIPMTNGKEYFLCTEPEDYANRIKYLLRGECDFSKIEDNTKKLILSTYNLQTDSDRFSHLVELLIK